MSDSVMEDQTEPEPSPSFNEYPFDEGDYVTVDWSEGVSPHDEISGVIEGICRSAGGVVVSVTDYDDENYPSGRTFDAAPEWIDADPEIQSPNGWVELGKDDRSSTIAYFVAGAECVVPISDAPTGSEVLIWRGVGTEDGGCALTSHLDNDIPDDARFLIEIHREKLVAEVFADSRGKAFKKANEEIQRLTGGEASRGE